MTKPDRILQFVMKNLNLLDRVLFLWDTHTKAAGMEGVPRRD